MTAVRIDIDAKHYRMPDGSRLPVLEDFHLELSDGEVVCLFGPSGCGKTTILQLIAGLDKDFSGRVLVDHAAQAPKVGYVFQEPRLLPWLTAEQNIALVLASPTDPIVVADLIAAMRLQEQRASYPHQLSGGQARRVSLARALAIQPDLLLLDEPFASLDAEAADRQRRHLIELFEDRPTTALFVTHDAAEAALLADRIVVLSARPARIRREVPIDMTRSERLRPEVLMELVEQLHAGDYLERGEPERPGRPA